MAKRAGGKPSAFFCIIVIHVFAMTLKEIRSHVLLVAQNLKLAKDVRISERHVDFMIHEYRARGIRETYARNGEIDPSWISDYGDTPVTIVNSADDPDVPLTSKCIWKFDLPDIVSLPDDRGIHRISFASRQSDFYKIDEQSFYTIQPGEVEAKYDYWWRIGPAMYGSWRDKGIKTVRPFLILGNPMEGFVLQTTWVQDGDLTVGQSYTVYVTQVIHNAVAYNPGDTFTAVNANFTGNGKVMFTNRKRAMTINDPYPMDRTLLEYVTIKIFANEFGIAKQQVADISADAMDKTAQLQNEDVVRRSREEKEG